MKRFRMKVKQFFCNHQWTYLNGAGLKTCDKCNKTDAVYMGWL